ncbi:MAG: CHASE3 domain-containing protein [bacterium]
MKMSIGMKIGAGYVLALLMLLIIGSVSYYSVTNLIRAEDKVARTHQIIAKLELLFTELVNVETGQRGYLLTGDDKYLEPYTDSLVRIDDSYQKLKELILDKTQHERLKSLRPLIDNKLEFTKQTIEVRKKSGFIPSIDMLKTGKGKKIMDEIRVKTDEMEVTENNLLDIRHKESTDTATGVKLFIVYGIIGAIIILSIVGFFITGSIANPLKQLTGNAQQISIGDLNVTIPSTKRKDEVGALTQAFMQMINYMSNMAIISQAVADGDLTAKVSSISEKDILGNAFVRMVDSLRHQINELLTGVTLLVSAASEISATAAQLASSATETASSVSQTTTTVEEVKQTSRVAIDKAKEVSESAKRTELVSQNGEQAVSATIAGIQQIREQMVHIAESIMSLSEQSQAIGEIISSVDDLAEQSNLLAVNAAIEAAKAGDQGKGFAVVAREVKSLAEQSRQATRQVRTILNDIQKATGAAVMATEQGNKAVEAGVIQSGKVNESLLVLSASISESTQMAMQIMASSQQQFAGVDQVTSAMENIKEATRQNVDGAQQLEESAHNLNALGQRLKELVDQYRL